MILSKGAIIVQATKELESPLRNKYIESLEENFFVFICYFMIVMS